MDATSDWYPLLAEQFAAPYWTELMAFVADERASHQVFPPANEVFNALHQTPLGNTKVVILGQDPYHGEHQANGLAFSVRDGVKIPPSLRNIHKELEADLAIPPPTHGNLRSWTAEGVLLLNTTLTVRAHNAASHQNRGWETFTDQVIALVNAKPETVVFILWGASARKKKQLIDRERHVILEAPHPSPLSAHRGFFGTKPFSQANNALVSAGRSAVDWTI